jgi:hypothetical protein
MPRQIKFGHEHAIDESCLFGCLRLVCLEADLRCAVGYYFSLFYSGWIFASKLNFANRLHCFVMIKSALGLDLI